jgi:hypothetical protein
MNELAFVLSHYAVIGLFGLVSYVLGQGLPLAHAQFESRKHQRFARST